jgi:hypothetical protein
MDGNDQQQETTITNKNAAMEQQKQVELVWPAISKYGFRYSKYIKLSQFNKEEWTKYQWRRTEMWSA